MKEYSEGLELGKRKGSILSNPYWKEYPDRAKTDEEECMARRWIDGWVDGYKESKQ